MKYEELPDRPTAPELIESATVSSSGMDLLGLRSPAETVAYSMLDAITTVTPNVRYLSVRTWIIYRYAELHGLDSYREFMTFAHKVESSLVMGNLLNDPTMPYLIGSDAALKIINNDTDLLELGPLVKIPAMNIYAGPTQQLKIAWRGNGIPGLTEERGLPLAKIVDKAFQESKVPMSITSDNEPQTFTREELKAFGHCFPLRDPSGEEKELLINFIMPINPSWDEIPRISTYCLILHLCKEAGKEIKEEDLFHSAISKDIATIPSVLHSSCEGWARFVVRDMIVSVHEAAVGLVHKHITETSGEINSRLRNEVLSELTSDDLSCGLKAFGLPAELIDKPVSDFCNILKERFLNIRRVGNINRWNDAINEMAIIKSAKATPSGMITLPLAWWIAVHRMEPGLKDEIPGFDLEGYKASARIGVQDIILPEVADWSSSTVSLRDIVARLIARSVDQHLRIAWSRLAREPWKDVSVLSSDGDEWSHCNTYSNGQATSRLYQAINWLRQLGLITETGLSPDGLVILQTRLKALQQMEDQQK